MKVLSTFGILGVSFWTIVFCVACSPQSSPDPIVGAWVGWEGSDGLHKFTMTFNPDKTGVYNNEKTRDSFTWRIQPGQAPSHDGCIYIDFASGTKVFKTYDMWDGTMKLTNGYDKGNWYGYGQDFTLKRY